MRHGKTINHLGRTAPHRKALLKNLSISILISEKKRIRTTLAKAKALRKFLEPLITRAKVNTTHNRRTIFSYLQDKDAVKEIFGPVAAAIADRPGGYMRIMKLGPRKTDNAEMAFIELVDFNQWTKDTPKKATTRKRKPTSKKAGSKKGAAKTKAKAKPTKESEAAEESPAEGTEE